MKFKIIDTSKMGIKEGTVGNMDSEVVLKMIDDSLQNCKVESQMVSLSPGVWAIRTTVKARIKEWGEEPETYSIDRQSPMFEENKVWFNYQLRWYVKDHVVALASELGKVRYADVGRL